MTATGGLYAETELRVTGKFRSRINVGTIIAEGEEGVRAITGGAAIAVDGGYAPEIRRPR